MACIYWGNFSPAIAAPPPKKRPAYAVYDKGQATKPAQKPAKTLPVAGYPSSAPAAPATTPAARLPEQILIILDASGSMNERLPDSTETKLETAKRVIVDLLKTLPPNTHLGLRVYGSQGGDLLGLTSCSASKTLVPIGPNTQLSIEVALSKIRAMGATPISYSLRKALAQDFLPGQGAQSIILVSDGMETCAEDPCMVAADFIRNGVPIKINVVGFGLNENYQAINQLRCVAMSTYGQFSTAETAAQLAQQLSRAVRHDVQATVIRGQ